jgi:hypothetical protein
LGFGAGTACRRTGFVTAGTGAAGFTVGLLTIAARGRRATGAGAAGGLAVAAVLALAFLGVGMKWAKRAPTLPIISRIW